MENVQLSLLHENSEGYFTVAKMGKKWKQYYFNNLDSIYINLNGNDIYISQNTFNNKSRKLIHLKELKALYIDLDCYKMKISKEAAAYFINDLYGVIPIPNLLIDSGRGLYYIIFLENTEANELPKWQLVEKFLYEKLKDLGADSKALDASRVLRVIGSINSKVNSVVKVIDSYDYKYSLDEIIEHYIPEVNEERIEKQKPPNKRKKGRKKKFVSLFNLYNLYYTRYEDIKRLVEIRNYDMEGYREITLFLIRYFLNVYYTDDEKSLEEILYINSMFKNPLSDKEVINATKSATVGSSESKYKYSNDKLIKLLNITPLEQKEMATIISKSEKYYRNNAQRRKNRRNEEGFTKREVSKLENIERVKKLIEENPKYSIRKIAEELNLSKSYVDRLLKEIEK